jgi:hypothetical protein
MSMSIQGTVIRKVIDLIVAEPEECDSADKLAAFLAEKLLPSEVEILKKATFAELFVEATIGDFLTLATIRLPAESQILNPEP